MNHSLSVIMPALNEEKNIAAALTGALGALRDAGIGEYEIIVATCPDKNGYVDGTGSIVADFTAQDARVRLLHCPNYQQLGEKYRSAVLSATKEYVVMIPGDNENDSGSFPALFKRIGEADMVVSYTANPLVRPWHRRVLSSLYTFGLNVLFGHRMRYYNGINIYRRDQLSQALPQGASFAYSAEILLTLLSRGATFVEAPVTIQPRDGHSKALSWQNLKGVIKTIFDLRARLSRKSST